MTTPPGYSRVFGAKVIFMDLRSQCLQSVSFIGQMRRLRQKNRSIHQRQQTEDRGTAYCVILSPSVDRCCRGCAAAGVRLRPGGCGETLQHATRNHLFLDITF